MYVLRTVVLAMLVAVSMEAQPADLVMAQQALASADAAGAQVFAKSLYEDAAYRARICASLRFDGVFELQFSCAKRARYAASS